MGDANDTAGVIAPPPLIYAAAVLIGLLLQVVEPIPAVPVVAGRVLGLLLLIAGVLLGSWAVSTLRRAGTDPRPYQPTTALVAIGPYRFTRNPIYLAYTLIGAGVGVLLNAFWILLLVALALLVVRFGVVAREERYLDRRFGPRYADYRNRVRRWL